MKQKLILFFSLCMFQFIHSQTDFRQGYIITNTGEKIEGLINYREGVRSYNYCDFKRSDEQTIVSYIPNQIRGYGFENDKYYESKEILSDNSSPKTLFIEVLVKGNATLYKYKSQFFIEKNDTIFKELENIEKDIKVNKKWVRKSANRHIGTLLYLFSDCPEIKNTIENLFLGEKSLTDLVERYNDCGGQPSITFKEKKAWFKTILGVSAGLTSSSLNFDNTIEARGFFTTDLGTTSAISFGAFIDMLSPRVNERISFHTGIFYLSTTYKANQLDEASNYTYRYDVNTELEQIKIPIGIRYTFPEKNTTPYVTLGISNNINLKSISIWTEERERNNIVETFEDSLDLTDIRFGYWGGVGIKKIISNKLTGFIEARFDYSTGFPKNDQFETVQYKLTSFQLLIGLSI